jgi:hypothetical protein
VDIVYGQDGAALEDGMVATFSGQQVEVFASFSVERNMKKSPCPKACYFP